MHGGIAICVEASVYVWRRQYICEDISICVEALVYTWRHQYIHGDIHVLSLEAETESSEVLLL